MNYKIYPLKVGSFQYYRGAFNSDPEQYKEMEEFPIMIFLLEGNGRKILVDTAQGPYFIASDAVPVYDCIERLAEGEYAVSTLCADLEAYYQTFERLKYLQEKEGAVILASHDFRTLRQVCYPGE
ncbi:MAG TPA: hypothetical protein H9717_00825 [Candidatus Eisenbergiella merdipullorum]|uniref:Uncharacterized protein n=1 Tax=Candidatus Eisenbergiella merdipullorum TaxID=2838553 RepID=A0A9D2KXP4_9FIRM|nr:hypothetical protein [Candidatus Eisenbergiella merdipullorum]